MTKIAAILFLCAATTAQAGIDNRMFQSPVRNQLGRGTCTAFAVAGALEAMPGMPTQLSTQYLFAIMKKTELEQNIKKYLSTGVRPSEFVTSGEELKHYVQVLQDYGIPSERFLPYNGLPPEQTLACGLKSDFTTKIPDLEFLCQARVTDDQILRTTPYGKYHLGRDSEVLIRPSVQNPENLTKLLDDQRAGSWIRSIPVSYAILSSHWNDTALHGNIELDSHIQVELQLSTGSLRMSLADALRRADFKSLDDAGKVLLLKFGDKDEWGGHAVEIVGYDNSGFIIKNSWGTSWGDRGYGHISFAYHRMFATQALAIRSTWSKPPSEVPASVHFADYRLKVFFDPLHRVVSLSTYTESREDPPFTLVTYQVYAQGIMGDWFRATQLPTFYSSPIYPEYWSQGYGATFRNVTTLPTRLAAIVTYYTDPNTYTSRTYMDIGQPGMHDFAPAVDRVTIR